MHMRWNSIATAGVAGLVLVATASVPLASAAPAPVSFLAQWKQAEDAYVGWDLKAAEAAMEPLLPGVVALDGHQRVWFDFSAARLLALVGRDAEARAFIRDAAAVEGRKGYVRYRSQQARRCDVEMGDPELDPSYSPKDMRDLTLELPGSFRRSLPQGGGRRVIASSYFGGVRTHGRKGHRRTWCDAVFPRRAGGGVGPATGMSRYIVVIPSREPIVAKRRVAPGAAVPVQAFATRGKRLIATWRPAAAGRATVRRSYAVRDDQATITAPSRPGRYRLRVGVGRPADVATRVPGVVVGPG